MGRGTRNVKKEVPGTPNLDQHARLASTEEDTETTTQHHRPNQVEGHRIDSRRAAAGKEDPDDRNHRTSPVEEQSKSDHSAQKQSISDLKNGREGENSAPTRTSNTRVSPLLIKWVLISTIALCVYTHHNAHSSKITSTQYPQSYLPPMYTPTIYSSSCSPTSPTPTRYPLSHLPQMLTHPTNRRSLTPSKYRHNRPPRLKYAPYISISPSPPTQHNTTHTKVSKTICTHHLTNAYIKKSQKIHNNLSMHLPPQLYRRP